MMYVCVGVSHATQEVYVCLDNGFNFELLYLLSIDAVNSWFFQVYHMVSSICMNFVALVQGHPQLIS